MFHLEHNLKNTSLFFMQTPNYLGIFLSTLAGIRLVSGPLIGSKTKFSSHLVKNSWGQQQIRTSDQKLLKEHGVVDLEQQVENMKGNVVGDYCRNAPGRPGWKQSWLKSLRQCVWFFWLLGVGDFVHLSFPGHSILFESDALEMVFLIRTNATDAKPSSFIFLLICFCLCKWVLNVNFS